MWWPSTSTAPKGSQSLSASLGHCPRRRRAGALEGKLFFTVPRTVDWTHLKNSDGLGKIPGGQPQEIQGGQVVAPPSHPRTRQALHMGSDRIHRRAPRGRRFSSSRRSPNRFPNGSTNRAASQRTTSSRSELTRGSRPRLPRRLERSRTAGRDLGTSSSSTPPRAAFSPSLASKAFLSRPPPREKSCANRTRRSVSSERPSVIGDSEDNQERSRVGCQKGRQHSEVFARYRWRWRSGRQHPAARSYGRRACRRSLSTATRTSQRGGPPRARGQSPEPPRTVNNEIIWQKLSEGRGEEKVTWYIPKSCIANATTILAHDVRWKGVIARDDFKEAEVMLTMPPWHPSDLEGAVVGPWTDADITRSLPGSSTPTK